MKGQQNTRGLSKKLRPLGSAVSQTATISKDVVQRLYISPWLQSYNIMNTIPNEKL